MKCERALQILGGVIQKQLAATPAELAELEQAELLVSIDLGARDQALALIGVASSRGGLKGAPFDRMLAPDWLQAALRKLEADLRSDMHRSTTSAEKLWQEEAERARMRHLLGVLADPASTREMRAAHHVSQAIGGAALASLPGQPRAVAVSPFGQRAARALAERIQRYQQKSLGEFLTKFAKADRQMEEMAAAAAQLDQAIGPVPKGKHQVVMGLLKSGLPPAQAAAAYQQGMRASGVGLAKEKSHLAAALVRGAAQRGNLGAEVQRLDQAAALLQKYFGQTPVVRGASKTLLDFPRLEDGLRRFHALAEGLKRLAYQGDELIKSAARLMSVSAPEAAAVQRVQIALDHLARSSIHKAPRLRWFAVALGAAAQGTDDIPALVARFLDLAAAFHAAKVPVDPFDLALDGLTFPGPPREVVSTTLEAAARFAQGQPVQPQHIQMASAFARRFAF